jgi:glycosyltransferase involved in cell wall biosynthesis
MPFAERVAGEAGGATGRTAPPRLRVGMDFRPAMAPTTGIGRYVRGLAGALAEAGVDVRLYAVFLRGNRREKRGPPPGTKLVAWRFPARVMNALGRHGILPADRALGGCDLFHHTDYVLAEVTRGLPQVMTVHDLAFLKDPSFHLPAAARTLEAIVRRAAGRCAAFLVPSEATARDCRELLGVERIFVTPLGVDEDFFALPPGAPSRPYLLAVGTLEPRKNFARLIRAHARSGVDLDLLIAGRRGWLHGDVLEAARGSPRVRLLGHVPEPELRALLMGATAFLYPSLLEGFGLPVLEAMAAGRPVLTSDREPMRGVAGAAAVLVDPEDEDAIADGIRRVVEAPPRGGPERARAYTWRACAEATRRAYEAVLG